MIRLPPKPDKPGHALYRAGDLGRWLPDGKIEFLGRTDHQAKIRGFQIELSEIEARQAEHEAVREAVVLVHEDSPGDKRLVAYFPPGRHIHPPQAPNLCAAISRRSSPIK